MTYMWYNGSSCSIYLLDGFGFFFPRASERKVLLIVRVCYILYIFKHLHIFSSYIFTSSHLHIFSSSHLLIFSSSHLLSLALLPSCPLALLLSCPLALLPSCPLALLPSCPLALLPSCPLALLPSCPLALLLLLSCSLALLPLALFSLLLFYFSLKARGSADKAPRNATLSHKIRLGRQKLM